MVENAEKRPHELDRAVPHGTPQIFATCVTPGETKLLQANHGRGGADAACGFPPTQTRWPAVRKKIRPPLTAGEE
jgi:hypothetical protein